MSVRCSNHIGVFGAGAVIAIVLALALPAQTRAACGGVYDIHATHHPPGQRPPLAIGDSTMLLAAYPLAHRGFEVNAHGCRQMPEALALIRQRRAAGTLPHMVVIALGSNGSVTPDAIGVALGLLCCKSWLVLVTPRELGGGSGSDAETERIEARKHRDRTILLDWVAYSAGHGNWFQPDGLHLTTAGATAFTNFLSRALPEAYTKHKPKHRKKRRRRAAAAEALSLRATLKQLGYVGAVVTGTPGVLVQLSSQIVRLGTTRPLEVVRLSGGTADIPHLLAWGCGARELRLTASTVPPALAAEASTVITTPACSGRLVARIARRVRVGARLTIVVRDRWRIGSLPFSECVTPPGARRSCRSLALAPGQRLATLSVPIPRPGGWLVSLGTRYGDHHAALVWASHRSGRILLLAAGDSEMQILDDFIAQDLRGHGVDVVDDARISTGLTKPAMFDWEAHARRQAATLRPDITVMFIGANDGFDVAGPHGQVGCCGSDWSTGYATLVAQMMRTYLRGGSGRVYWFVLPTPRPGNFQSLFQGVNTGIRAAAARFPGCVGLIDAESFFTPGGRYRDFMSYHGHGFVIHEPDGIHLSDAADQVAAGLVAGRLLRDRVIR